MNIKLKITYLSRIALIFIFLITFSKNAQSYNCFKEFLKRTIPPKNISKAEYKEFIIAQRIYSAIWEIKKQEKKLDVPVVKLLPEKSKTHKGFYLEYCYEYPKYLYTPWGAISIVGNFNNLDWHNANPKILCYLQAKRVDLLHSNMLNLDHARSLYTIHEVNNIPLKNPTTQRGVNINDTDIIQAKEHWDIMHKYYYIIGDNIKAECSPFLISEFY